MGGLGEHHLVQTDVSAAIFQHTKTSVTCDESALQIEAGAKEVSPYVCVCGAGRRLF